MTAPIKMKIYRNGQEVGEFIADGEDYEFNYSLVDGDVISYRMVAMTIEELWAYVAEEQENNIGYPFSLPSQLFNVKKVTGVEFDSLELKIDQVEFEETNFEDAFKDLTPKEFVKDVMQRFGLTPIPDKYENHITFYTLEETLNIGLAIDWTESIEKEQMKATLIKTMRNQTYSNTNIQKKRKVIQTEF